ncbi:hypothetical protein FM106_18020 [Brachybacterium faecium]|nr:hypothetical protein FM106_18020 [Brachybacterium faecium]
MPDGASRGSSRTLIGSSARGARLGDFGPGIHPFRGSPALSPRYLAELPDNSAGIYFSNADVT